MKSCEDESFVFWNAINMAIKTMGKRARISQRTLSSITFETAVNWNLELLRIFSSITGAPIAVADEAVFVNATLRKRVFWALSLGAVLVRMIFIGGGLFLSLTFDRYWNAIYFPFYATVFMGASLGFVCGYFCLTLETGNFAMTWNLLLKYKSEVKSPKPMVWLLSYVFPLANAFPVAMSLFLALNPELVIQFRFAVTWALEEGLLTPGPTYWALVTLTTVADFWSATLVMANILTVLQFHMLFLETWTSLMSQLINRSRRKLFALQVNKVCRELVTALRVFNVGNATIVFATKIFCLTCSITSLSSLLVLDFSNNLLFFIIILSLSTFGPLMYPAIYHRAPAVGAALQRVKYELLAVRLLTSSDDSFERRLLAISPKGIWIGGFRTYERESDLIYLGFIVNQVASIVLM